MTSRPAILSASRMGAAVVLLQAAAALAGDLNLAGDREIIWIAHTRIGPGDSLAHIRLAFMALDKPSLKFHPLNQEDIGGEIKSVAVRQRNLHTFFRDGTHIRYEPEIRRVAEPPQEAWTWELKLPDNSVPTALAGDADAGVLYAVVRGRIATEVDLAAAAEEADLGTDGPALPAAAERMPIDRDVRPHDESQSTRPGPELRAAPATLPATTTRPAIRPVEAAYCLVRFERGRWHRDREIPHWLDGHSDCRLAVDRGVCDLYFVHPGEDDRIWFARGDAEGWSEPEKVQEECWHRLLACDLSNGKSRALIRHDNELKLFVRGESGWVTVRTIHAPADAALPADAERVTGCLAGERVALAWEDPRGEPSAAVWDTEAKLLVAPQIVAALQPAPDAKGLNTFREVAPFAVLGLSLYYVFTRRRESVVYPAILQENQRLAGYGRRLAAFLLDVVIIAPAALPILYGWARHLDPEGDALEGVQIAMAEHFAELFWRWFIALAAFVLYCIIFEAVRGGTPGKLLLGCRVVSDRGEPCELRAILWRNLLRLLELFPLFDFAPLLLLVFLTRNRQRLGDLVARTIVVEKRPFEWPDELKQ